MKRSFCIFLLSFIFFALSSITGCSEEDTAQRILVKGTQTATKTSSGLQYDKGLCIKFDGFNNGFTLEELSQSDAAHNSITCNKCGFEEYNNEKAYHICNNNSLKSGFAVIFEKPVKASSITDIRINYMFTSQKDTGSLSSKSEIKIYNLSDEALSGSLNTSINLKVNTDTWMPMDLKIRDMKSFEDENGYIKGFRFYINNKDNADLYINSFILRIDTESLAVVKIPDICKNEKDTTETIAELINKNLRDVNIENDVTVKCESYLQNTAKYNGEITYSVKINVGKGKNFEFYNIKQTIPHFNNQWLADDNLWQHEHDKNGIIRITNKNITCEDAIDHIEYTVIKIDQDYKEKNIVWYEPQNVQYSKNGIKELFINAFMDYGNTLKEGEDYKIIVRAVTDNKNYIAHINYNFKYEYYSYDIAYSLSEAYSKTLKMKLYSDGLLNDLQSVKNKIEAEINNKNIVVNVSQIPNGVCTYNYKVSLSHKDDNFNNYSGIAFTVDRFAVLRDSSIEKSLILPVAPYDGQTDIMISSYYIINHWEASFEDRMRTDFENYYNGEVCTPKPVVFSWDINFKTKNTECILLLSEDRSFSTKLEYSLAGSSIAVYNLKAGQRYYWKVLADGHESPVFTFETCKDYTRYIKADGVFNIRDIGGYNTQNGKIIKQGLVYRSANLDTVSKDGKLTLTKEVGIKTDLDLREDYGKSPIGKNVNYLGFPMKWYSGIFSEEAMPVVCQIVKVFADSSNYPIDYHCAIGRDRTGTLTILLYGILGVDEETAISEYFLSLYSSMGDYSEKTAKDMHANIEGLLAGFNKYGDSDSSFNEKVENYLLASGVTREEINKIREIMLEDKKFDINGQMYKKESSSKSVIIISFCVCVVLILAFTVIIYKKRKHNN